MSEAVSKRWFAEGALVGVAVGGLLAGFFVYTGPFFLVLFMVFALLHQNLKMKLRWWGFIAGAIPATLFTWFIVFPRLN